MDSNQEWQRLHTLYAAMSDDELLDLASDKVELTPVAQQVVDAEITSRRLELPPTEAAPMASTTSPEEDDPSLMELSTFQVPGDAERAMKLLEEQGIPARMDYAVRQIVEDGPKVKMNWLSIFVGRASKESAMATLRDGMGLFPLPDTTMLEPDEDGDDDTLSILGNFEEAADAEAVRKALTDAGIWFQVDDEPGVPGTMVEVRPEDFERAIQVVEAAFGEEV